MAKDNNSEAAKKVAEAEKASKKKASSKPKNADGNIFQRAGKAIVKYFKDLKGEKKKIIWPGGKMVLKSTLVVIVCVLIVGAVIWLADFGLSKGIDAVLGIGKEETTVAAEEAEGAEAIAEQVTEAETEAAEAENAKEAATEAAETSNAPSAQDDGAEAATEAESAKEEATEPTAVAAATESVETAD